MPSLFDRYFTTKTYTKYGEAVTDHELNLGAALLDALILVVLLVLLFGSFTVISPSERAVKVTLGTSESKVTQPGLHFKLPIISTYRTYDLDPHSEVMDIAVGPQGAISSDNQTIGVGAKVVWTYDSDRIMDLVDKYPDADKLSSIVTSTVYEALKSEIGKYSIYDLAKSAGKIATDTRTSASEKLKPYPVILSQFNLTNWDWSDDFDAQIKSTMNKRQQVEQAKAEADKVEQEQRKLAIVAEATAKAEVAKAEGNKAAAELNAAAKRAEGQGIADYNKLIAQNPDMELRFRQLEIEKIRAEKWNGVYVSEYVPLTAAGGIVSLPNATSQEGKPATKSK